MLKIWLLPLILLSGLAAQNPFLSAEQDASQSAVDTVKQSQETGVSREPGAESLTDSTRRTESDSTANTAPGVEGDAPDSSQDQALPFGLEAPAENPGSAQTGSNPFLNQPSSSADMPAAEGPALDMLMSIERGAVLSRLTPKPDYIKTQGKLGYTFQLGLKFPFKEFFHAGASLCYYQVEYFLKESLESLYGGSYQIKTTETLNFLALPVDLGIRHDFGFVSPNLFIQAAPAVFVSGHYFAEKKLQTVFPGNESITHNETLDRDISKERDRGRFQLIYGGGGGLDIPYGYGIITLKAGCDFFALDLGDNEENTLPVRSSSRLMLFYLSLGLKFYL